MMFKNYVRIKDITIKNYRSFSPDDIVLNGFTGINIFVGPNGVGKSNFFNAIRYCLNWNTFNSQGTLNLQRNYNDPQKSIEIYIDFEDEQSNSYEIQLTQRPNTEIPERKTDENNDIRILEFINQRTFPIGLPRQISVFINSNHPVKYEDINRNWKNICQDTKDYLDITLPNICPLRSNDDRIFYTIYDENGASLLEGSDGKANFLFMVFSIRARESGSVILIEEPEMCMHPRLQKRFLDYLKYLVETENYQFLITTHSPYLLNFAVSDRVGKISIYRLSKFNRCTQITKIENISNQKWEILTDLGHLPADVLQANCIIWVEGPSDRIYLNYWIKAFDNMLEEGLHYSIMFYGGRLLNRLSFKYDEIGELIALRKINPNSAIIIDSDWNGKGREIKLNQSKRRICKEFENGTGFAWVTAGREIENYIPSEIMEKAIKSIYPYSEGIVSNGKYDYCYRFKCKRGGIRKKIDKIKIAEQVIQNEVDFNRFDLYDRVYETVAFIRQCNGLD